jgi:hypothetical protein
MPTKRTPISRSPRSQVTPAALEIFRKMLRLERKCTCKAEGGHECAACTEWQELDTALWCELRLKPWQMPSYERPENVEPRPSDHADFGGPVARYRMLKQALKGTGIRSAR